ncbi:2OG-Fe(II) oxygenase [Thiohalobacter thiocyanaticus]|uniref:2OG-Fe(II) oxygenase n=1 Tax=Thiohalobacter thiocyanaticus TaxID=585455 RepID=UPI0012FE678C|nr:2OG-Fe(II) oxygenase [Thiohalobacter thiocyanaticus]
MMPSPIELRDCPPVKVLDLPGAAALNRELLPAYHDQLAAGVERRSHFFAGRYENIYIGRERLPAIEPVLRAACAVTARLHGGVPGDYRAGFWFNDTPPGGRTLPHTHDDDDELVSCVYYVQVPDNAGCLAVEEGGQRLLVRPRAGRMVLFAPDALHWVTPNLSGDSRLSIGINVGRTA